MPDSGLLQHLKEQANTFEGDSGAARNGGCPDNGEASSADKVSSSSSEEMYLGVKPAVPWNEADRRTGFCVLETSKGKFNAWYYTNNLCAVSTAEEYLTLFGKVELNNSTTQV